jgi:hypothetical protein
VGSGWHHLKLTFSGAHIKVFYDQDPQPMIHVQDLAYKTGVAGLDFWADSGEPGPSFNNFRVAELYGHECFRDEFGKDPVVPEILSRWADYQLY